MKKTNKSNPLKFFNDNKVKAYKKAGGAMKTFQKNLKKAQDGINVVDPNADYNKNYPLAQDAEKEIKYILDQGQSWTNPKAAGSVTVGYPISLDSADYGDSETGTKFGRLPKYAGIHWPQASNRSMKQYRDEIDAFYKANPNVTRYVGRLPIRKAGELSSTVNKDLRKKGGAIKAKPKAKK